MSDLNLRDIITERMRSPFTRAGLAETILAASPDLSPDAAARIAGDAIDRAVRAGTVSFRREAGAAIFRPAGRAV